MDDILAKVNLDHPDLNPDGIQSLRIAESSGLRRQNTEVERAKELLFYWQVWRWVTEGELTIDKQRLLAAAA